MFDFGRGGSPEKVWSQLRQAAAREDGQRFLDLCRQHRDLIKRELPKWRVITVTAQTTQADVDLQGLTLRTIAEFFAEYLGDTGPRDLLMSRPDDERNAEHDAAQRWQKVLAQCDALIREGNIREAQPMLESLLREMDSTGGTVVDHLRAMVLGRIADCRLRAKDYDAALRATKEAWEHCRRVGDEEGVRIYAENIVLIHAEAGTDPKQIDEGIAARGGRAEIIGLLRRLRRAAEQGEVPHLDAVLAKLDSSDPGMVRAAAKEITTELNNAGIALRDSGNVRGARLLCERAVRIYRHAAPRDETFARMLANLAHMLMLLRTQLPRAGELLREALEIQQRLLPAGHRDILETLHNLGALHDISGDPSQAREHYLQAISAKESSEADPSSLRNTLDHLAKLELGEYNDPRAKPVLERLMRIERPADAPIEEIWESLNQLIDLYVRMGNSEAAKPLVAELVARAEKEGKTSKWYGFALQQQAAIHAAENRRDAAAQLFLQAVEIIRKAGVETESLSAALNNAGLFYLESGDDARAIEFLDEALALKTERNLKWAATATNLGNTYARSGRVREAIDLQTEALSIRKRDLPEGHPYRAQTAFNLAMAFIHAKRLDDAVALLSESLREENLAIDAAFGVASEEERSAFLRAVLERVAIAGVMLLPHNEEHPAIASVFFDMAVQRKAILAETIASERELLALNAHSELRPTFDELLAVRGKIARLTLDGGEDAAAQIAPLRSRRRELELEIARIIPDVALAERLRRADRNALAAALPPRSALIDFLAFDMVASGDTSVRAYLGFILPSGEPERVAMCVLGSASTIDPLIEQIRKDLQAELQRRDLVVPIREQWTRLSTELWTHLARSFAPALEGCERLFIVPDGALHRLPFGVLRTESGQAVGDRFEISYLSTARDLLRLQQHAETRASAPVVIAAPDYDAGGAAEKAAKVFPPLAATRAEGEAVAAVLRVRPLLGTEATERALKAQRSPFILHIATHGFFVQDKSRAAASLRSARRMPRAFAENDALLRSGLALAGANSWMAGSPTNDDLEDGILFAEDVLSMDLTGTEMVVLSACETGLGEYQVGEGIFGLRRALMLAGARTLIVSLWRVPDEATRELMEQFYRELQRGARRVEALRIAQRRVAQRYESPYCWEGFICIGDPEALPPNAFLTA